MLTCYVCSTKIGEISDISKCFENFVSQALGVLTRIYAAELRFNKEAIIYPGEGTEFMPRYYNGKFALHQRCYAIFDFKEDVNPQYLYFLLKTQNTYFIKNAVGSTVPSLRIDTFQKLKVIIPSLKIQHNVSSFLSKLEQKVNIEKTILQMLLKQKQHLLRQMFI